MKKEQIIEGNKLIAKFMGMEQVGTKKLLYSIIINGMAKGYYHPEKMLYHKSWDWLMPVVEKIETIRPKNSGYPIRVLIDYCHCSIDDVERGFWWETKGANLSKIQATWEAVVEFIQWHNENK